VLSNRNWNSKQYKKWRISVYRRDNFQCRWPQCKSKRRLNAHHIFGWSKHPLLRFEKNNGITLCYKHHKMVTGKEDHYSSFFMKLIRKNGKK